VAECIYTSLNLHHGEGKTSIMKLVLVISCGAGNQLKENMVLVNAI
jgi:hypothetical protein